MQIKIAYLNCAINESHQHLFHSPYTVITYCVSEIAGEGEGFVTRSSSHFTALAEVEVFCNWCCIDLYGLLQAVEVLTLPWKTGEGITWKLCY